MAIDGETVFALPANRVHRARPRELPVIFLLAFAVGVALGAMHRHIEVHWVADPSAETIAHLN